YLAAGGAERQRIVTRAYQAERRPDNAGHGESGQGRKRVGIVRLQFPPRILRDEKINATVLDVRFDKGPGANARKNPKPATFESTRNRPANRINDSARSRVNAASGEFDVNA